MFLFVRRSGDKDSARCPVRSPALLVGDSVVLRIEPPGHFFGMAGWLTRKFGLHLWMTRLEYLINELPRHGLRQRARGGGGVVPCAIWQFRQPDSPLPDSYRRLVDGEELRIGPHLWRVVVGNGHSPEHACLYCPDLKVLISGDQVLPRISSNVSVHPIEPDANPMADWYASLDKLKREVPDDVLVLPSHYECFRGLHARLDYLTAGQNHALTCLKEALVEPRRAVDVFGALFGRTIGEANVSLLGIATGGSLACLNYLRHQGAVEMNIGADGVAWYEASSRK